MEEKKYINFTDAKGNHKKAEIIVSFIAGEPSKKYVIYTLNEESNDMVAMYAAILEEDEFGVSLENIENENEWKMVKGIMRDIVKGNGEV